MHALSSEATCRLGYAAPLECCNHSAQEHPPVCQLASPEHPTSIFKGLCCWPFLILPSFVIPGQETFLQLSWASPAMLSKGQIQCSCTHSLLAWRSAKLRLSGSTHCFMRPLRCMSKQRLERNRCLSSTIRLETLTGSCLGLLALPRWMLSEMVCVVFLPQLLQKVLFLHYAQSSFAM